MASIGDLRLEIKASMVGPQKESRNSIICPKQDGAFPLMLRF